MLHGVCRPRTLSERLKLTDVEPAQPASEQQRVTEPVVKRVSRPNVEVVVKEKKKGSVFERLAGLRMNKGSASAAADTAENKPRRTTLASTVKVGCVIVDRFVT